jgi:hypothetical protein
MQENEVKTNNTLARMLFLLLYCLLSQNALAQRKTDIVTLYNGDRITGEVKSLYGGILHFSTDSMGTIKIEWQEIASLKSTYYYEVRRSDGVRHFGSFEESPRPGYLLVRQLDANREIEWLQVVELRPIEDKGIERIDAYLAAGYSFNRASDVGLTTFNTTISYEDENSRNELSARATHTQTEDETTKSARLKLDRYIWNDRSELFRLTFANYETNDELDLDHRIGVGAGVGRYFMDTHQLRVMGATGLQVITEQTPAEGEEQNVELIISTSFATWRFNTPELEVDMSFSLYPSLTDSGRVRSDTDLTIRWEIIEDLFFDITAFGSSDNRADSDKQFDYGVTTGIGWTY